MSRQLREMALLSLESLVAHMRAFSGGNGFQGKYVEKAGATGPMLTMK